MSSLVRKIFIFQFASMWIHDVVCIVQVTVIFEEGLQDADKVSKFLSAIVAQVEAIVEFYLVS